MRTISWGPQAEWQSTWLRGMFVSGFSFQETVARLITLSGQRGEQNAGDKTSVEFEGTFRGQPFTLYDYKGDDQIHVGGNDHLALFPLLDELKEELGKVEPTPYVANYDHEYGGGSHTWAK